MLAEKHGLQLREPASSSRSPICSISRARLPARAELVSTGRPLSSSTPWTNEDGGVLARPVRNANAYDDPGTGVPLKEVTWSEDLISKPVLPVAVGIADGEGARHSSPSRSAWRVAQARVTAEGKLSVVTC